MKIVEVLIIIFCVVFVVAVAGVNIYRRIRNKKNGTPSGCCGCPYANSCKSTKGGSCSCGNSSIDKIEQNDPQNTKCCHDNLNENKDS